MGFQAWDAIMSQAARNVEVLKEIDCVHQLACILKTNVRAAKSLGHVYVGQVNLAVGDFFVIV